MLFLSKKFSNSSLTKIINLSRDKSMIITDMDDLVGNASIHLEYKSTTRIILPSNDPAKSSLTHGRDSHFHGCRGTTVD